jgi:Zn-finger nucleic acid-binding protein
MTPSPDAPSCPTCAATLTLGANGLAAFWSCPNGHGAACTVTAAYSRIDGEEIRRLWHASESAPAGSRACPMCGTTMVEIPAGADTAPAPVDACRADELFWLDAGELEQLPQPAPEAPPSAEEEHKLAAIRRTFDEGLDAAFREQTSGVFDRLADRISYRHPTFSPLLGSDRPSSDDASDRVA